ncbi:DUF2304 domain-containing protein [Paenibacillus frigoriresistens]|uniref:DUF2304 domain-containing protein n=1 Tax=Paenibacillus alginolyticus TaxID=59839 RepID=UPI0015673F5C|nr:DUF2304 domain-containing protein [Paenibacillus frigoriresistens]NRF95757.1 DUF2304 domain-containing protein [Paenibacillus frigoriresistens]
MIITKLQVVLLVVSLLSFIVLLNMIQKYKLELKYALLWLLLSFITILLAVFPKISLLITSLLGIETPVNTLFLLFIVATLAIVFSLTLALSRSSNEIKDLVQEIGMMKCELERMMKSSNQLKENNMKDMKD